MSWWVYLVDDAGEPVYVEPHQEGGTYVMGGCNQAELNVTYNYGGHFSFRDLHGKGAKDTISILEEAVRRLGTDRAADYWEPTKGNVGHTCQILLNWAQQHPEGAWVVH